ncbi:MAG: hypothetical protein GF364_02260 [Candidatus Lokiarchaeota archaeon]|nr:hypothetical protein [Candidatus Lokiarchaeota archaeon]
MADQEDYNLKRGKHMEGIADQHYSIKEFAKAARLYKDAFNNFKKGADKDSCLRIKEKFEKCKEKLKE